MPNIESKTIFPVNLHFIKQRNVFGSSRGQVKDGPCLSICLVCLLNIHCIVDSTVWTLEVS